MESETLLKDYNKEKKDRMGHIKRYYDNEIQMNVIEISKEYYFTVPPSLRNANYGLKPVKIKLV